MKLGIFADLHLRKGGRKVGLIDKKLDDGKKVLQQVVKIFRENNIDMFVFMGDFYHARYQIDVEASSIAADVLAPLATLRGVFIPGNHDLYHRNISEINSLASFGLHWSVILHPTKSLADILDVSTKIGWNLIYVPFKEVFTDSDYDMLNKLSEWRKDTVLFLHQLFPGFPIQMDYSVMEGKEVFDYTRSTATLILSGHSHIPYTKGNVFALGSIMEHSFADCGGGERFCYILELKEQSSWTLKKVSLQSPKYITVESLKEVKKDDNYYRLKIKESEYSKTLQVPENVQIVRIPEEKVVDRLELGDQWKWPDIIKKFTQLKGKGKEYEEYGIQVISQIGG